MDYAIIFSSKLITDAQFWKLYLSSQTTAVSWFDATVGSFVRRCTKWTRDKQNFKNTFKNITTELFNSFWGALKTVQSCWQDESSGPTEKISFRSSWGTLKTVTVVLTRRMFRPDKEDIFSVQLGRVENSTVVLTRWRFKSDKEVIFSVQLGRVKNSTVVLTRWRFTPDKDWDVFGRVDPTKKLGIIFRI